MDGWIREDHGCLLVCDSEFQGVVAKSTGDVHCRTGSVSLKVRMSKPSWISTRPAVKQTMIYANNNIHLYVYVYDWRSSSRSILKNSKPNPTPTLSSLPTQSVHSNSCNLSLATISQSYSSHKSPSQDSQSTRYSTTPAPVNSPRTPS